MFAKTEAISASVCDDASRSIWGFVCETKRPEIIEDGEPRTGPRNLEEVPLGADVKDWASDRDGRRTRAADPEGMWALFDAREQHRDDGRARQ
jgi:hypothetical protein